MTKSRMDALFVWAAMEHDWVWFKHLLENGADVNAKDRHGRTALMDAARRNDIRIAELLIGCGAYVDADDSNGQTALMYAAIADNLEVAKLLIECGADINAKDNNRNTVLNIATDNGSKRVKEYLESIDALPF